MPGTKKVSIMSANVGFPRAKRPRRRCSTCESDGNCASESEASTGDVSGRMTSSNIIVFSSEVAILLKLSQLKNPIKIVFKFPRNK